MTANDELPKSDFRYAAIQATTASGRKSPPALAAAQTSGVWLAAPGGRAQFRRCAIIGWTATGLALAFALLGVIGGKVPSAKPWEGILLSVGVTGLALGLAVGLLTPRIITRRAISRRMESYGAPEGRGVFVSVENALTYHQPKGSPEDNAILVIDPVSHCMRLYGLICIYDIARADIGSVGVVQGSISTSAGVWFRVGDTRLSLSLTDLSLWDEFKRRFGFHRPSLLKRIERGLQWEPQ